MASFTNYNWAVFTGWIQVLVFAIKALNESRPAAVYDAVEKPLQLAQTATILEVEFDDGLQKMIIMLYSLKPVVRLSTGLLVNGLVRSPVSATQPQIGSTLFVTWGILHSFPEA
ncbi:Very-long-chain (3R)-3-hydroxyacyl-CoA dehydratase [Rhynchospora pubera]|uniref:very-long-chain (3R)-3-hydroxyacyl-CoA dehydratase n=1 Tax=Rhynchospora pubera TaxID=906938 RepID=A0AAV8GWW2_9POAL|nr:Very-long-chain (3R)-3-hydroxyacyl-CoA dehydratase [Rhynchospora pubera]